MIAKGSHIGLKERYLGTRRFKGVKLDIID